MQIDYTGLPKHMRDGAHLYIEHGVEPGGFLRAVLSNQLVESFGRADETNRAAMFDWATWLYNECPRDAWGSPEKVDAWIESRQASVQQERDRL
jgi:hypothetical protein